MTALPWGETRAQASGIRVRSLLPAVVFSGPQKETVPLFLTLWAILRAPWLDFACSQNCQILRLLLVTDACSSLCDHVSCSTPAFPRRYCLLKSSPTHVHWAADTIQPSHPLLPSSPFSFHLSQHQGFFSNDSTLRIRWPKDWSFSISLSSEYSGLISFRMDWFDLLAVRGTLKSLLQHRSSKHQFFTAQPSLWCNCHIWTWLLEKS